MLEIILLLVFVAVVFVIFAVVGHVFWLIGAEILKALFGFDTKPVGPRIPHELRCEICFNPSSHDNDFCGYCGCLRRTALLSDVEASKRVLHRLHKSKRIDAFSYGRWKECLDAEFVRLNDPRPSNSYQREPRATAAPPTVPTTVIHLPVDHEPAPSFFSDEPELSADDQQSPPVVTQPRRRFSDMLNSFMEESNIRWGEIVGGLLIIGCSTALVVSLWAQISQIPVLKFLIFTTVTAVLFGIGLYTEHRWKLPNTSLGILTIATLLVPLNFLAIAAVSSAASSGSLILASEIIAPAVFLTLVYYAGRVITPGCARILSAGVLLSSIGQLLVRHFATAETVGFPLVVLGAVPVICFLITVGCTLKTILEKRVMGEVEVRALFIVLGTMSFASALPFGLLLYKAGPLGMTMMYLAPAVTMWGLPLLLTGVVIWRQVRESDRVATRTTGGTLALMGVVIAAAGVLLAWPNPASIVPSALIAFFVFTAIAVWLDLRVGHLLAAICLALAYVVTFQVAAGNVPWTNLRVYSLLNASLSSSSGQAIVGIFFIFLLASEWLVRRGRSRESVYYEVAAGVVALVSLALVTLFGAWNSAEVHHAWFVYLSYSAGAFWLARKHRLQPLTWVGSTLSLLAASQAFAHVLNFAFPWQTALLLHAALAAAASVAILRRDRNESLWKPLYFSSFISSFAAIVCLFQANPWQVTASQAARAFLISATWLVLLWINRKRLLFIAIQGATTVAVILTVKAALQEADWYAYLPHAFLHPTGLLIQAIVLLFVGLVWIALRITFRSLAQRHIEQNDSHWSLDAWKLLDLTYSIDRALSWSLLAGFLLLLVYAVSSGITQELAAYGSDYNGYNLAGFPRHEVIGMMSWIVLGLLLVTMLGHALERRLSRYLLGAVVVSTALVPLVAGVFESEIAVASAWRWLSVLYLIAASIALWYRKGIAKRLASVGWPKLNEDADTIAKRIRTVVVLFSIVPLVLLTLYPSLRAIYYLPVRGPASGIFSLLDIGISYSVPLIFVAAVFVGYSLRDRSAHFALAAGAFLNAAVTIAYLLSVVASAGLMDRVVLTRTIQLNAITSSLFALAWLKYKRLWEARLNEQELKAARDISLIQTYVPLLLNAVLILPAAAALFLWPTKLGVGVVAAANFLGWLSFALAVGAFWLSSARSSLTPASLCGVLGGVVCLLALVLAQLNPEMMTGLHSLAVGMTVTSWMLFTASNVRAEVLRRFTTFDHVRWPIETRWFAVISGIVAVTLTLRPGLQDPSTDWWTISLLLTQSALFAALHGQVFRRAFLAIGVVLFNIAGWIWWISFASDWFSLRAPQGWIIILSISGLLSLLLELRTRSKGNVIQKSIAVHDVVSFISLSAITMLVAIGLLDGFPSPLTQFPNLAWMATLLVAALFVACIYDERSKHAVAGLYITGLVSSGLIIHQLLLDPTKQIWLAVILLSAQALLASLLWWRRKDVVEICTRFRIPSRIGESITDLRWLTWFNLTLVVTAVYLALITVFQADRFALRVTAAIAVFAQAATFLWLVDGQKRGRWQTATITMLIVGAVFIGWSWLMPFSTNRVLHRGAILTAELCAAVTLVSVCLNRIRDSHSEWTNTLRRCLPWMTAAAVASIVISIDIEFIEYLTFAAVRIHHAGVILLAVTLFASVFMLVLASLKPLLDPLQLTERGRTKYIYAAEILLALLFVHVRLTEPWLFGSFERFWPFIVMFIAYTGVLVSEALRRQQLNVLARPLERTAVFLPLLPVLGFWIAESEVDYSALLFVVGGLYGLLSLLRRSFPFGVIAAVCANGSLWYFLQRTENYQFLQHPQLWLIPVALCVLLAAHLNEDDFTEDQMASTRYLSLVTIYLSSTADIIINGVADSPWLPLILAAFSLAGIFGGIILRIRGMLLLGSTFLLFAIFTMIWYASENFGWTWLWYVAGIVTGATIIFMFAVFEKKRSEVLRLVEGLREWDR